MNNENLKQYLNGVRKCRKLIKKCLTTSNVMLSAANAEWHINDQVVRFFVGNGGKEYLYKEWENFYVGEKLERALTDFVQERKIFKNPRGIKLRLDYKYSSGFPGASKYFMAYPVA